MQLFLVVILGFITSVSATSLSKVLRNFPSNFYFRQLSPGVNFAIDKQVPVFALAQQMKNFVYVFGDKITGEAVVVDGAWDVDGITSLVESDNMTITASINTHYHWDHIGGQMQGQIIPGIKDWADLGLPVWIPSVEQEEAATLTDTPIGSLSPLADNDRMMVGSFELQFLHTPGHSPGSMCVQVRHDAADLALITADTLFPGSCGRLDLPGSDPYIMYDSLQRLSQLPASLPVFPGHAYGGWGSTIGQEKKAGLLQPMSRQAWARRMGLKLEL